MSLLRQDITTNDWVIFAPERARRPHERKQASAVSFQQDSSAADCPFCPGNEWLTGPEIYALRGGSAPNTPGWQVRVIPNKFPALRIEDETQRLEDGPAFRYMGGCGAHEVIIESPDHDVFLARQPVEQVELLLRTLQLRFNDLMRDARFQAIVIFKNHGEQAGTSLRHPHCQLIATPVVPQMLRLKHRVAEEYFDRTGRCVYCVLLHEELLARQRVVAENEHYAAITPYASHVPFEIWILPKRHQSSFGSVDVALIRPLAQLLKTMLIKLDSCLENPAFNLTVNAAPRGDEGKEYFLWHLQILPRLTTSAGFEMGSGMSINTALPEESAACLREVDTE